MANEETAKEPVVYRYQPRHDGDGYAGVPQRDLTKADVDALIGSARRDVLHPDVDPIYVAVEKKPDAKPDEKKGSGS